MDTTSLKEAGLTEGEIKVYISLLGLGSSTTGPIIQKSSIARSIIYQILEKLAHKGLVSHITKEKTKYFQAAEPNKILEYIDERESKLKDNKRKVAELLPELLLKQKMSKKSETNMYFGFKGIRTLHEHIYSKLKKGEEYYSFGIPAYQPEEQHLYWQKDHLRRIKTGIKCKLLFNFDTESKVIENRNSYKGCEAKLMKTNIKTPGYFMIFKDTTGIILQHPTSIAIEIINQEIADSFKAYFDGLWIQEFSSYEGIKGIKELLYELREAGGKEHHTFGSSVKSLMLGDAWWKSYHQRRVEKGIHAKLMFNESLRGWMSTSNYKNAEIKFTKAGFEPLTETIIRNDKLGIIIWTDKPIGILIHNKAAAESYDKFFETMWNNDTSTYKGTKGVESFFKQLINEKECWFIGGNFGIADFPELWKWYKEERIKRKQMWHDLIDYDAQLRDDLSKEPYYEYKLLPKEMKSPHVIAFAGKTVANIIWAGKNTTIFVVENKELVKSYKKYFELLWRTAHK